MGKHSVWHKSSYSTFEGNCVEVADLDDGRHAVRDSKDPTGPKLVFSGEQWTAFTIGLGAGDFA